jgi:hypothetical protein
MPAAKASDLLATPGFNLIQSPAAYGNCWRKRRWAWRRLNNDKQTEKRENFLHPMYYSRESPPVW